MPDDDDPGGQAAVPRGRTAPRCRTAVALRVEAWVVGPPVTAVGMGPRRAAVAGAALAAATPAGTPLALTGVCGGLVPGVAPGDVVVATAVTTAPGGPGGARRWELDAEPVLAAVRGAGLRAVAGVLVSVDRLARGPAVRAALAAGGAVAVDMETAALLAALDGRPVAVARTVADAPGSGMVIGGLRALASLRRLRPALDAWAASVG